MITSRQNPKIQLVKNLLSKKRERDESGLIVLEGVRLIEEAVKSGCFPVQAFYCSNLTPRGNKLVDSIIHRTDQIEEVSESVMSSITETETSQGIIAQFVKPVIKLPANYTFLLIIDNIRDPGNLGTIIRTALAAGANAILVSPGSTDVYSPKTLRSAMGAHFHLPILEANWESIRETCNIGRNGQLKVYLADSNNGLSCWDANLKSPLALIICNEADGPTDDARNISDASLLIPMGSKSESLNAAVAAGILLFEVVRQRQK